jgi:pyruvate/2-oxoglutarate dehydrogenase complex dihydrolipoamide dehydrogenase (E3) component
MPTKALLQAAEVLHLMKKSHVWGLQTSSTGFDYDAVLERKNRLIEEFAAYRRNQLAKGAFQFIRAQATFTDAHTLSLSTGGTLRAKKFIICTGSHVPPPPVPGLKEIGYWTSDTALAARKLPKSLIVLGGGPVALELAQYFARFGVKIAVVQRSGHVMKSSDDDAAEVLERAFRSEGISVFTDTKLLEAWREGGLKGVSFRHQGQTIRLAAQEILHALGRVPNTAGLALEKAGVYLENGRIIVNTEMQTTASHIFAAGDCTGTYEIVHVAIQQGEIAAQNTARRSRKISIDYRVLCSVVFTDPQMAQVGLTEKEAQERDLPYIVATYPFNDHGKSIVMDAMHGFVKMIAHPTTGEILGGSVVGPLGGELIHEVIVAMQNRMTVKAFAATPHYHPTLSEIWTYPAEELAEKVGKRSRKPAR